MGIGLKAGPAERTSSGPMRTCTAGSTSTGESKPARLAPTASFASRARPTARRSVKSLPGGFRDARSRALMFVLAIDVGSECCMHVVSLTGRLPGTSVQTQTTRADECARHAIVSEQSYRSARHLVPAEVPAALSGWLAASRNAGLNTPKLHVKPLVEPGGIEPPTSALPVRRSPS